MEKRCLIAPTEEEIFERDPLLKFSFFLSERNNWINSTGIEILSNLDKGFSDLKINSEYIGKASFLSWFWTLGVYEIIRTITQAQDCFSIQFIEAIKKLKKEIELVRMPSAKMEKKKNGKRKIPVNSNRCHDYWDIEKKDLLIGEPDNPFSVRLLIKHYDSVFSSLRKEDIVKRHEESDLYLCY